ncbi:Ig-like domain repeat protein [Variovorax sp. V116]|uniref:Ig-like domain repeat protein n=1 Tax=Variovorax sp. V116 TaxID=3065953 RepID=UPI0034E889FE
MVAIISGNSLGLSLGSLAALGQRGQVGTAGQGRSGEQSFVNIANGNLVLQGRDDVLIGRGLDVQAVRTYNSQGLLTDDNGDNWSVGAFGQKVVLTSGTVGTAGSTLMRTDRDGAQAIYTWDVGRNGYVSPAGSGAFDTIAYNNGAAQFIWTDGDTGRVERYQSSGVGRLISITDADGNTVSYAYNANGTVLSVTDANGDITYYDYSGTNLTQLRTVAKSTDGQTNVTLTRVRYAYDSSNRLSTVIVDLSPEDNAVADGKTYVTTYTYDGTSKRIASVTQGDGTKLSFTYVQAGGSYKVETVTDALGQVTRFTYSATTGTTTVTDPLGAQSTYLYDAQGQLLQMHQGVTAGNLSGLSQVSYRYDDAGNVTGVTDGEGREVAYEYDANGNLLKETDSAGNLHTRTYNAANQLLTDTVYADAAVSRGVFSKEASLAEITRYVYAQGNPRLLRFSISAQGDVTEHRYDSYGQAVTTVRYTGGGYNVSPLGATAVPTEAQMTTWAASSSTQDLRRTERTDRVYDARGALSSSTTYGEIDATGAGIAASAAKTQYVYDQHGWLLKTIEPTGGGTTTYVYDGLGRVLSVSAPSLDGGTTANTTVTSYDDAGGKTSVTIATGLVTVSAYDKAGRLVSATQQSTGTGVLGTTIYAYDKGGNLLMTQDPTGVRKWMLYDEAGRKIVDIDATGAVIEYVYNASGQLRQTVAYATRLTAPKLAQLVDGAGLPTTAWSATNTTTSLAGLRPAANTAQDQKVWRFYDNAGRLAWQVDAFGYVTQTTYDGASRILSVTKLAKPIDVAPLLNGADVNLGVDPSTLGGIALSLNDPGPTALARLAVLTAAVEGAENGGMVTFFDGETVIGSALVIDGKAVFALDRFSVGTHSLRAAYSGDLWRPASVSKAVQKIITPATTAATLSAQRNPTAGAQAAILSVGLTTPERTDLALASGLVTFYNGSKVLGVGIVINGVATLAVNELPKGILALRAEYNGDATHIKATSYLEWSTDGLIPTATTLKIAGIPSTRIGFLGQFDSYTLSAFVTNVGGASSAVPAGTVSFYNGTAFIGSAAVVNGVATLQISSFSANPLRAVYSGGGGNAGSSTPIDQYGSAVPSPTNLTLTAQPYFNSSGLFYLTARVAGAIPTGVVTFFAGTQLLGSSNVGSSGEALLPTTFLPLGTSTVLKAVYSGDANNANSILNEGAAVAIPSTKTSLPRGDYLSPDGPVTFIHSPNGRFIFGVGYGSVGVSGVNEQRTYQSNWAVTAPVNPADEGNEREHYSFRFDSDGRLAIYTDGGMVAVDFGTAGKGGQSLELQDDGNLVLYTSDRKVVWSTGPATAPFQPTQKEPRELTNAVDLLLAQEAVVGLPMPASISLVAPPNVPSPSATLSVFDGQKLIASFSNPYANGFSLPPMSLGIHPLRLVYVNGAFAASRTIELNVKPAVSEIVVNASKSVVPFGSPAVLTAQVALAAALRSDAFVGRMATGVVTFYRNGVALGTAQVVNGVATLSISDLPAGVASFTASYGGDENYRSSQTSSDSWVKMEGFSVSLINLTTPTIAQDGGLSVQVTGKTPTGLVSFYSGTTLLGTVAVREDGTAILRGVPIPVGTHTFSAVYSGDESNADGAITFTQSVTGTSIPTVLVGLDAAQDRTTTQLYNRNGQLQGTLDAEGYLTEYKYNAAGERIETIRYADRAANFTSVSVRMAAVAIARASGDLKGLRPVGSNPDDIRTYAFYNARGQLVGQVDGEGYLTETIYDARGNLAQTKRYYNLAKTPGSATATLATIRPDLHAQDQSVTQTWSAANQLLRVWASLWVFRIRSIGRGLRSERLARAWVPAWAPCSMCLAVCWRGLANGPPPGAWPWATSPPRG